MKRILITGSTDGIGKLAALKLAKAGNDVLLHGRNTDKLNKVIEEIKESTGNEKVSGFISDLSDLNSIRKLIAGINGSYDNLDVLINNAGVFKSRNSQTSDGVDIRFAVNYFAPVLLTEGLSPLLKNSDTPRVINLSSAAQASVSLDALLGKVMLGDQEAYAQSKLALTMWTFHFAKTHPEITSIAVNPGSLLNTKMVQEAYGRHWSPATKGSDILYNLAMEAEYANSSGKYFDNDQGNPKGGFGDAHSDAYNVNKITELITITDNYLNA